MRRYISQENINGTQTIAAYEAMQEKYYSSTLYSHIPVSYTHLDVYKRQALYRSAMYICG